MAVDGGEVVSSIIFSRILHLLPIAELIVAVRVYDGAKRDRAMRLGASATGCASTAGAAADRRPRKRRVALKAETRRDVVTCSPPSGSPLAALARTTRALEESLSSSMGRILVAVLFARWPRCRACRLYEVCATRSWSAPPANSGRRSPPHDGDAGNDPRLTPMGSVHPTDCRVVR